MKKMFKEAIDQYGQYFADDGGFSRWMLPDGSFLGVHSADDHRIVGEFCEKSWTEFIKENAVSISYDKSCGYLWLRVNENLLLEQRLAFYELYENFGFHVSELYIQVYDGQRYVEDFRLEDRGMIRLFLTDIIAYNLEKEHSDYFDFDC